MHPALHVTLRSAKHALKRCAQQIQNKESTYQQLQRQLTVQYALARQSGQKAYTSIADAGFRCYSQCDEDGIILYILSMIGFGGRKVVEMCAGSGDECMAANLILNHGFEGYLFEGDPANIRLAQKYYASKKDCIALAPVIRQAWITAENVNTLLEQAGVTGEVDMFSLDIDGNDYWVWKAVETIRPRLCVFETHNIIPSDRSITVRYDPRFCAPKEAPASDYKGASLAAMVRLSREKGYRLIGGHRHGFNAFFLRNDIAPELFPEVSVESVHANPYTERERAKRWPGVQHMDWVDV